MPENTLDIPALEAQRIEVANELKKLGKKTDPVTNHLRCMLTTKDERIKDRIAYMRVHGNGPKQQQKPQPKKAEPDLPTIIRNLLN